MSKMPASATQKRVCSLYGLEHNGSYEHAAATLEAAGLPKNGCPDDYTWQNVKQLTDDELCSLLGTAKNPGKIEVKKYHKRKLGDSIREAKARKRQNEKLRAMGYFWKRIPIGTSVRELLFDGAYDYYEEPDRGDRWALIGPDGKEVFDIEEILKEG